MIDQTSRRPVKQLSVDVARKIAAGEVIDRPAAIIRELLDNAVDSSADSISVEITGGGIDSIRISDNGWGMSQDDLKNCARPHATSKISDAQDLMNLSTLGFRGEALASIAAVSRLSIASGTWKMRASITEDHIIDPCAPVQNGKGTIVQSEGLFENFPARRQFLKRPASEGLMCKDIFVEKSLPRPDIGFKLTIDGKTRFNLFSGQTLTQRFVQALELKESSSLFSHLSSSSDSTDNTNWSFNLIIGEPSVYRNDRKNIYIYVNGRKVTEYSLVQAIEYGCQGYFPNGVHPVAALFVNIDPSQVDFNIHPAKREVRFKDISALHHGVSTTVKTFFHSYGIKQIEEEPSADIETSFDFSFPSSPSFSYSKINDTATDNGKNTGDFRSRFFQYEKSAPLPVKKPDSNYQSILTNAIEEADYSISDSKTVNDDIKYLGCTLGTFILLEVKDTIYFIDQHAAHERILFNKILASGGEKQNLLVPYTITTESNSDDKYIAEIIEILKTAGFSGSYQGKGKWEFTTVPVRWTGTQKDFEEALLKEHIKPEEILYKIAAMTACKAAVKDGYVLDDKSAENLARQALLLKDPHCPHGRPVWTTLTREQLFARVKRT